MPDRKKIIIQKTERQLKSEQHQAKLTALTEKKKQGKLTLDDLDEKLNIVLERQEEILKILHRGGS